jgi:serine/threonine protein kinase
LLEKNITPYLADFGLARMVGAGESHTEPGYDALSAPAVHPLPEQAQGVKDLTAALDIYSFGVEAQPNCLSGAYCSMATLSR